MMGDEGHSTAANPGPSVNEESPLLGDTAGNVVSAEESGQSLVSESKELPNRRLAAVFGSVWVCF